MSDESHTITVSVTDSGGASGRDVISITVGSAAVSTVTVSSIDYSTEGGRFQDEYLLLTLGLVDDAGNPVSGEDISAVLKNTSAGNSWGFTGTTGTDGKVTFSLNNAPSGTYTTTVTDVSASGLTWDGINPENSFTK